MNRATVTGWRGGEGGEGKIEQIRAALEGYHPPSLKIESQEWEEDAVMRPLLKHARTVLFACHVYHFAAAVIHGRPRCLIYARRPVVKESKR